MSHLHSSLALQEITEETKEEFTPQLLVRERYLSVPYTSLDSASVQVVKVSGSIVVSF